MHETFRHRCDDYNDDDDDAEDDVDAATAAAAADISAAAAAAMIQLRRVVNCVRLSSECVFVSARARVFFVVCLDY